MAIIPATIVTIDTSTYVNFIENEKYYGRNLVSNSYNCDATGYSSKFGQCTCGFIHHLDKCPVCGSTKTTRNERDSVRSIVSKINGIRDWLNTKVETVVETVRSVATIHPALAAAA